MLQSLSIPLPQSSSSFSSPCSSSSSDRSIHNKSSRSSGSGISNVSSNNSRSRNSNEDQKTPSNNSFLTTPPPNLKRSRSVSPSVAAATPTTLTQEPILESPILFISSPIGNDIPIVRDVSAAEDVGKGTTRLTAENRPTPIPKLKRSASNRSLKEIPTELLPTIVSVSSPSSSNPSPSPLLEEVRRQQGDLSIPVFHSPNSSLSPPFSSSTTKGKLIKQPSFNNTDQTRRSLKNSENSSSTSTSSTFLTEVSLKSIDFSIPTPPKQVHKLPEFLFSTLTETIEHCKFPSNFLKLQFPRQKLLNPKYVLNKTLVLYFPSLFSDKTHSEHRIQFNDLFLTEHNQCILVDSFWWFFLTIFSKDYLCRKASQYYEYMIERELDNRGEKNNFFLRREQHKIYKEKGDNWACQVYQLLLKELPAIENRISNNYAELVVKFITHRSYTIKTNIQLDLDDIFIEVISKSVFLAYGLNFPDCSELFETKPFQSRIARQFQLWCFGVSTIQLPFLDSVWKFKMELKSPPVDKNNHHNNLSAKQRFRKAIQSVREGYSESIVRAKEIREELSKTLDQLEENEYSPAYNLYEMFYEEEAEFVEMRKQNKRQQIIDAFTSGTTLKEEELNEIIECDDRDEELFIELQLLKEKKEKNKSNNSLPSKEIKQVVSVRDKAWYEMGEGTTKTPITNLKQVKSLGTFKTYSHSKKSSPLVSQYLTLLRHNKATERKQEKLEKRVELRRSYMKE